VANEIKVSYSSGATISVILWNPAGQVYQTTTTTYVTYVNANRANYLFSLTETTGSGVYMGNIPSGSAAGFYSVEAFKTPFAVADRIAGWGIDYSGSGLSYIESRLAPTVQGRTLVVDAAGLADATTVKLGPSGSGTAQTARDIGASVLLSSGTGTGQVSLSSGAVVNVTNVTANVAGNVVGSVGSVAANGITSASFAAGATLPRVTLVDTLTTYTGNTPQTGDSFARIGSTGSGLTSLAPSATALSTAQWTNTLATNLGTTNTTVSTNLDTTITSRMATYTQPTGFLAATFPSGTITNNTDTPSWYTAPGSAPTVGQIATAVWQDTTAGDFTVAGSIGRSLFTSGNAPGAASGLALVGSNMGSVTGITGVTFPLNFGDLAITAGAVDISTASQSSLVSATSAAVTSAHGSGSYVRNTEPPTAADNATAVANYDIGNGRTIAYFLQGGSNRIAFAADGLSFTVYTTDDTTPLYTGTSTRLGSTIGGLRSTDPA
jgi:hypothetical protein